MNATQKRYAVAKAALDAANAIEIERLAPYEYLLDSENEADNEKWSVICTAIDTELNIKELAAILHTAEDEMVAWANAKVSKSKHFSPRYQKAMNEVMVGYKHQMSIRKQMIDLAFRLG